MASDPRDASAPETAGGSSNGPIPIGPQPASPSPTGTMTIVAK